jgi:hypothetical protein
LAANNGDTMGEAVMFVKRIQIKISKEKFELKKTAENRTTSSSTIFSSEVLKDANQ